MTEFFGDLRVISGFAKAINILSVLKAALTVGIIVFSVLSGFNGYKRLKMQDNG